VFLRPNLFAECWWYIYPHLIIGIQLVVKLQLKTIKVDIICNSSGIISAYILILFFDKYINKVSKYPFFRMLILPENLREYYVGIFLVI
jgi:hypothetical protein